MHTLVCAVRSGAHHGSTVPILSSHAPRTTPLLLLVEVFKARSQLTQAEKEKARLEMRMAAKEREVSALAGKVGVVRT